MGRVCREAVRATLARLANSKNVSLLPSADLEQRLAELELAVAELQRGPGPRDPHEQRLLEGLLLLTADLDDFSTEAVLERGRIDPDFAVLLVAADVTDVAALGYILRGARGHCVQGRHLERVGRRWRFASAHACAICRSAQT